jgi:hypothetical protein
MKRKHTGILMAGIAALLLAFPEPAMAYIGPGGGMSAIGVFLALAAGIIAALLGFVWYPVKRLIRKVKQSQRPAPDETSE